VANPNCCLVIAQFPIHRQRRKPQVDSVDESDNIEGKRERQQPDPEFPDRFSPATEAYTSAPKAAVPHARIL